MTTRQLHWGLSFFSPSVITPCGRIQMIFLFHGVIVWLQMAIDDRAAHDVSIPGLDPIEQETP